MYVNHICERDSSDTFEYVKRNGMTRVEVFLLAGHGSILRRLGELYMTGNFAAEGLPDTSRKHCKTAAGCADAFKLGNG